MRNRQDRDAMEREKRQLLERLEAIEREERQKGSASRTSTGARVRAACKRTGFQNRKPRFAIDVPQRWQQRK